MLVKMLANMLANLPIDIYGEGSTIILGGGSVVISRINSFSPADMQTAEI